MVLEIAGLKKTEWMDGATRSTLFNVADNARKIVQAFDTDNMPVYRDFADYDFWNAVSPPLQGSDARVWNTFYASVTSENEPYDDPKDTKGYVRLFYSMAYHLHKDFGDTPSGESEVISHNHRAALQETLRRWGLPVLSREETIAQAPKMQELLQVMKQKRLESGIDKFMGRS